MSAPCLALCACSCWVTPWCLKLKILFTCLCWKHQQTHVCQNAVSSPKRWTWKIYFLFSCWTCIFSCLAGTWLGKAESASLVLWVTVGRRGAVWPSDPRAAREGLGTEVLFILSGSGVRRWAEEIPLQISQLSAVACPLPDLFLGMSLPFCRNLWS